MIDQAANAQVMNYEQFLIAQLIYQDGTKGKTERELHNMAQAVRNRANIPTRQFGNWVGDIIEDSGVMVVFPDGTDFEWQRSISAAGLIAGLVGISQIVVNAYSGGTTGAMNPDNAQYTTKIDNTDFHVEFRDGFNHSDVTSETLKARATHASYTNFLLALLIHKLSADEESTVKQSIAQTFRNIEATKLVTKSIPQIFRNLKITLEFAHIEDEKFIESIEATRSLVGSGFGTYDSNAMELNSGDIIKLDGRETKRTVIDGNTFIHVEPASGNIKIA